MTRDEMIEKAREYLEHEGYHKSYQQPKYLELMADFALTQTAETEGELRRLREEAESWTILAKGRAQMLVIGEMTTGQSDLSDDELLEMGFSTRQVKRLRNLALEKEKAV